MTKAIDTLKNTENRECPLNDVTKGRADGNSNEDEYVRLLQNRFKRSSLRSLFNKVTGYIELYDELWPGKRSATSHAF